MIPGSSGDATLSRGKPVKNVGIVAALSKDEAEALG